MNDCDPNSMITENHVMPRINFFYEKIFSLSLILSILLFPALASAVNIIVEGRIFTESGPLAEARVYVYKSYEDLAENKPFFTSSPTDFQGLYMFQLAPGDYYFTAKGNAGGKSFFAYHGINPVMVGRENIWLSFMANEEKQPVYADGVSAVRGIVTYKGEPIQGAYVAVYTLEAMKFKGLGFLAEKGIGSMKAVDKDGTFDFPLPPDKYVVIARKMQGGNEIRPLRNGDLYCYAPSNPIEVRPDKTVRIEVPCYPKGERLAFVNSPKIKTNDYLTIDKAKARIKYGIKGKVADGKGAPLQGVYVIAYRTDNSSNPTSEAQSVTETDVLGNFFIPLDTDGTYGLVVRDTLGGAPKINDISGFYNKDPWQGIPFKAGELIENVNLSIKEGRMLFE